MPLIPFPRSRIRSTHSPIGPRSAERWFRWVVTHRLAVLGLTLLAIVVAALYAGRLHKDTSANAYLEPDNPALLYREHVVDGGLGQQNADVLCGIPGL